MSGVSARGGLSAPEAPRGALHVTGGDALAVTFWFVLMAAAVYLASAWTLPFLQWKEFDNIYFQADIALVYSNMTEYDSNHYRTDMHPLFSIAMLPLVTLIKMMSGAAAESIVRLLLASNAGAAAALVYLVLCRIATTRLDAWLFTALFSVSAASMFWLTVPETFPFGGTTILLMLAVAATAHSRTQTLVLANVVTMSMTLTNWMVGIYATFRLLWPRWKTSLWVLVSAGCVVIALGVASKLFIPSSGHVGDFRRHVAWIRAPHASDVQSFVVHSIVMPAPVFRDRGDGALEVVNESSAAGSGSPAGTVGVVLWMILLVAGVVGAAKRQAASPLRDVLVLSIGSQFLLHVAFADGPFLFSAHFAPMLILVAAYSSTFRGVRPVLLAAIVAIALNNLLVRQQTVDRLNHDLLPWLEKHGTSMASSSTAVSRVPAVTPGRFADRQSELGAP